MNPCSSRLAYALITFSCSFFSTVAMFADDGDDLVLPVFTTEPSVLESLEFGDPLNLVVVATGLPDPTFVWEKDGKVIEGETGSSLHLRRVAPFDAGEYKARAINSAGEVLSSGALVTVNVDLESHSVARWWNEFMMEAIRRDFPDPTKHSRNLYHVSAAMWDAFWAYEEEQWTNAAPVFHKEEINQLASGDDRLEAQREAISHAAFTVLSYRYLKSPGSEASEFGFRWLMEQFGYDPDFTSVVGDSPAAVGNRIGQAVLDLNFSDGSNELNDYADTSNYEPINSDLPVDLFGTSVVDINRWQPLAFDFAISQNGIPIGEFVQTFLGVNWREVATFAMKKPTSSTIAFDPGPPPQFEGATRDEFIDAVVEVIRYSSYLDPADDEMIDISPGARLNNTVGTNDGVGRPMNPFADPPSPYPSNMVKRADYGRILAEFWADGPASETPPGHWNTLHNEVTEHPLFKRRYMGVGPELSALEWDVRAYVALNGGMHDSAVAAWTLKRQYDYSRPITMIRELGGNGQSSDSSLPDYHPDGLPLISGLIELVTFESSEKGERHEKFEFDVGEVVIRAWAGEPEDADTEVGGVDWIFPEDWLPYQRSTFVTPAFAAYVSGHSTFSRSGAEVMTLLTGSPYFPGGMGEFHFPQGEFLEFENGPSDDVTLQWATYYDAADQAGISRLYGGIHVRADDFVGRILGARLGVESFVKTHSLRNASDASGMLAKVATRQQVVADGDAALAQFDLVGGSLPVRFASSIAEAEAGDANAIYFVIPNTDELEALTEIQVVSNSGLVQGVEIRGQVTESNMLMVDVVLNSEEPVLLLAMGRGSSLDGGAGRIYLTAYERNAAGILNSPVGINYGWRNHETASLSEALILRGNDDLMLEETEAALPLVLVPGTYRFTLRSVGEGGEARMSVSGQSWR